MEVGKYFAVGTVDGGVKAGYGTVVLSVIGTMWAAQLAIVADWFTLPGVRATGNYIIERRNKKALEAPAGGPAA